MSLQAFPPSAAVLAVLALASCSSGSSAPGAAGSARESAAQGPNRPAATASPKKERGPTAHSGSTVARASTDDALYVADEDHQSLRVIPLPIDATRNPIELKLPGAPAQVVALAAAVLITIRDPGLLLLFKPKDENSIELVEVARVPLPDDAWGLAVTDDEKTAVVTSAWTHQVSGVDLTAAKARWTLDVAREPRGVVIRKDGTAYVTHLVGPGLTRIEGVASASPKTSSVSLPASPLRTPTGKTLAASLGYSAALSSDGGRLFVGRHALGAMGTAAWFGAATVDVLLTASDTPLAPLHIANAPLLVTKYAEGQPGTSELNLPGGSLAPFVQPRHVVYRKSMRTVLVVGEGNDAVVEFDALAVDPTTAPVATYTVGGDYDKYVPVAGSGGAPQGLALSADEKTAWVFCRSTYDLATIRLDTALAQTKHPKPEATLRLAEDALSKDASVGRRLFYNATDGVTSGGLACSGCHPEGRDDGYVWHETKFDTKVKGASTNFLGRPENVPGIKDDKAGFPRQTPMLAGRLGAKGPYGWHAEAPDLIARLRAGFGLHRWGEGEGVRVNLDARAGYLIPFLRKGLAEPPRPKRDLTEQESRGKAIFTSEIAQCAKCHDPASDYSDRTAYPLPKLPTISTFEDEEDMQFKTPSLKFVGNSPPYFHDGRHSTLEGLIDANNDRMGKTNHLSKEDKGALVAFLRTL